MTETALVREFGNAVIGPLDATLETPAVKEVIERDIKKYEKLLGYLKNVHYEEPFHPVEGPPDRLHLNKSFGWYGRVAAPGYDAFAEHFTCQREHVPYAITIPFITKMIERLIAEVSEQEEE